MRQGESRLNPTNGELFAIKKMRAFATFSHYEFIEKKEIDGKTYSLFLYVSEYADELPFVRVYEGDLESAFKNREKIPYREPVLDEYIGNAPDEDLHSPRYKTDIHFSDDGKSVVVEFNNGERQIIALEKADSPPAL